MSSQGKEGSPSLVLKRVQEGIFICARVCRPPCGRSLPKAGSMAMAVPSEPEWFQDALTKETMCDPVECSDGRTYDRWTILDNNITCSPFDPSHTDLWIVGPDIDLQERLFKAFPEQKARSSSRWKSDKSKKDASYALRHTSDGGGDNTDARCCCCCLCLTCLACIFLPCADVAEQFAVNSFLKSPRDTNE